CDTCSKCTSYICIDKRHLSSLIVVLIMHVVDHVQCINIQLGQPLHHLVIFLHNLVIVKVLGCDRSVQRRYLLFCLLVNTAVDRVQKAFCKVRTCSEELDLLTCLCCGYTATDRIVVAPYRTHHIIILILNGACLNRNISCIFLEVLRQV